MTDLPASDPAAFSYYRRRYDVVVAGAGHAGCEAAAAAARMGLSTLLITLQLDAIAQMSCNPAIGGTAKGIMVREIDALGGLMARVIDATGIQFRILNRSKGPAVRSPRAQADKRLYATVMKATLEATPNLDILQDSIEEILAEPLETSAEGTGVGGAPRRRVIGARTRNGLEIVAGAVILTTGTFLQGLIHVGQRTSRGGRAGEPAAMSLSGSLAKLGIELKRFKTGTPPRLNGRSIDTARLELQPGDQPAQPFSHFVDRIDRPMIPCHLTWTNARTHEILRANLHRAPLYTGQIAAQGPRYCPSVETKIVRFADRERHQIFLEPEGERTLEVYVNGMSTSLPPEVQDAALRTIEGLEHCRVIRYGYAIEYDWAPPHQIRPTLESRAIDGLYLAGQINGTSGYEEAAGQGLLAGINAALKLRGEPPFVLGRHEAYLGVMIDDLTTKDIFEPYRMFTSRAEYRLLLRMDNCLQRLAPQARRLGLYDTPSLARVDALDAQLGEARTRCERLRVDGRSAADFLRRHDMTWSAVIERFPALEALGLPAALSEHLAVEYRYEGYIERQNRSVAEMAQWEAAELPGDFDYMGVLGLKFEARERLTQFRPRTLGQAARLSGVTPADLSALAVVLHLSGR
ncbi:MAG: tRNA uridine-5-carboxymethylaminomethyl(34) synthesis enzyme MnmG [Planctomycetota bacterium]